MCPIYLRFVCFYYFLYKIQCLRIRRRPPHKNIKRRLRFRSHSSAHAQNSITFWRPTCAWGWRNRQSSPRSASRRRISQERWPLLCRAGRAGEQLSREEVPRAALRTVVPWSGVLASKGHGQEKRRRLEGKEGKRGVGTTSVLKCGRGAGLTGVRITILVGTNWNASVATCSAGYGQGFHLKDGPHASARGYGLTR